MTISAQPKEVDSMSQQPLLPDDSSGRTSDLGLDDDVEMASPSKAKPSATTNFNNTVNSYGGGTTYPYVLAPYPSPSELPPVGQSTFPMIWNRDPARSELKTFYVCVMLVALLGLYYVKAWLLPVVTTSIYTGWDEANGIDATTQRYWTILPILLEQALGLSLPRIHSIFMWTVGACVALVVADIVLARTSPSRTADEKQKSGHPWPASWGADNTACYHDMFSEPTRFGRLIRRPSNTFSNATYFYTSLIVLSATVSQTNDTSNNNINPNIFWVSDAMFGVMLFILAISSTLWHASNAPWTQYIDIGSMDSSILYLIIRFACIGGMLLLANHTSMSMETAHQVGSSGCVVIYTVVIGIIGKLHWGLFQKGWSHGPCPVTIRTRLAGTSCFLGQGHKDIYIGADVCFFGALPVLYMLCPMVVLFLVGSVGSVMGTTITIRTLVVGWSYRLTDRWLGDGNPIMNWCNEDPTTIKRTVAFFLSPTGVLHATTGITLLAAYAHARSVDEFLFTS